MSFRLMSAVWDMEIPSTEKMVLMCLSDHADEEGICWPSVSLICRKTSKSERTVQSALKWLKDNEYFDDQQRPGTSPVYTLNLRKFCTPAEIAPPQKLRGTPAESAPTPANLAPKPIKKQPRTDQAKKPQARDHELPDDWEPKEFGPKTECRKIVDGWPPGEREIQIERFCAHHRSRGNKFKEWQDAWKTWVLNSRGFGRGNRGSGSGNYRERDNRSGFERAIDRRREARIAAERPADEGDGGDRRRAPAQHSLL